MFNVISHQYDRLLVYDLHESGDERARELHDHASLHDDVLRGLVRVRVLRDHDCDRVLRGLFRARVLRDRDCDRVLRGHAFALRDVNRHAFVLHDVLDHVSDHDVHRGAGRQLLHLQHDNLN